MTPITEGDIRRCSSGEIERLALVLRVNSSRNTAQVTLVHTYREWATNYDIVVDPLTSGLRYPLVIETDLRGVVWLENLDDRLVGRVTAEVVAACLSFKAAIPEREGMSTGSRLAGPFDIRWRFKRDERHDLSALCADATAAALGE